MTQINRDLPYKAYMINKTRSTHTFVSTDDLNNYNNILSSTVFLINLSTEVLNIYLHPVGRNSSEAFHVTLPTYSVIL